MRNFIAYSSKELIDQYNYLGSGHFFDKDTMRFFGSRITENYKRLNDRVAFFVTTERSPSGVRRATIRRAELVEYMRESDKRICQKIKIDTVGKFHSLTLYQAKSAVKNIREDICVK